MGEDPQVIRRDIEETRERMGDTVDALGYKADVKSRTKDAVSDRVGSIKEKVGGSTPSTDDVKHGARRAGCMAKENPLGLAIGATAVGFIAGLLVPTSRIEDEKLGPMASDMRERAMEAGQEAVERGKQVAQDAMQTAKESGQEHAQELREQVSTSS
jgi:gas vesicle protein